MHKYNEEHERDNYGIMNDNGEGDQFQEEQDRHLETLNQMKQNSQRPESKHGRNQPIKGNYTNSAREPQVDAFRSGGNNNAAKYDQGSAVDRLSNYVTTHHISLQSFWKSNKIFATLEEFQNFLFEIGISPNDNDLEDFNVELVEDGFITIKRLCSQIRPWNNEQNAIFEFIRARSLQMAQNSKKQANNMFKNSKQPRPQSSVSQISGANRPISGISMTSNKSQLTGITDVKMGFEQPVSNQSKEYLQKYKEREKEINHLLELTINKGKNQYEYEMLIQMGDANELNHQMGKTITYRAYKNAKGTLMVHKWDLDVQKGQMTLQDFQREYNLIQNEYNEKRNLDPCVRLSQSKSSKSGNKFQNGASNKEDGEDKDIGGTSQMINKDERQTQLKTVLLDTMLLTSILKEQLKVLTSKPINSHIHNQTSSNFK